MRRTKFSFVCTAILCLTACSKEFTETSNIPEQQGEVKIALSAEASHAAVTKATDSNLPDVDDFTVEIFKVDGNERLYRDTYANTSGTTIFLNTGDYLLSAWHGDSLGVGFDAAYYAAQEPFTVQQQVTTSVNAVAKLSNVKVAVVYGTIVNHDYTNFYSIVRARQNTKYEVQFEKDETRAGYLPSGNLTLEFYAEVDGEWKYYSYDAGDFEPNDFVTFNVETVHGEGTVDLTITIDTGTDTVNKNITVPSTTLPNDAPKVTFSGFDEGNCAEAKEGGEPDTDVLKADIVAYGSIAHLYLNIDSDHLSAAGIPSQVDLANIGDNTAELLKDQGFKWSPAAAHILCYVDFYGILTKLCDETYDSANPFKAQISITVEDDLGQSTSSDTYTIFHTAPDPVFTYLINDCDIWATKLTNQSVNCTVGDPQYITLQYKADGDTDWTTVGNGTVNDTTISFGTISGLKGGTDYTFRAVYNGDEANAVSVDITTEEEAQVGNADFEDWATLSKRISVTLGSSYDQEYWQPYAEEDEDPWWASNGGETIITSITGLTNGHWMKCFPCIGPSTDTPSGDGYSAHLITVNLGNSNTAFDYIGTTHIGEIFTGTTNTDGDHVTDGHSFPSRPDKIAFDYTYEPYEDQSFCLEVELYAEDGSTIASYSTKEGPASSSWSTFEAELDYSVLTQKAASIYISLKASNITKGSSSSLTGNGNSGDGSGDNVEFNGETLEAHVGSSLRIDNIQLIYE